MNNPSESVWLRRYWERWHQDNQDRAERERQHELDREQEDQQGEGGWQNRFIGGYDMTWAAGLSDRAIWETITGVPQDTDLEEID